jgi:molybdopterin synthase catalytic subunit
MFSLSEHPIDAAMLYRRFDDPASGALVVFEGRVRNHHGGRSVRALEYSAYPELATAEGNRICRQAWLEFTLSEVLVVHRVGLLALGETAIWIGVSAPHRHEAFTGCRAIIDRIKESVPIWKKEFYGEGDPHWVACSCVPSLQGQKGGQVLSHSHPHSH